MKNIELTENHKSKLLEMCKVLFPEYTTIPNDKNPKFLTINWFTKQGYFIHLMDDDDLKENKMIHWFEFCMTHLINKISEIEDSKLGDDDYDSIHVNIINLNRKKYDNLCKNILDSWSNKKHPVDYLYEEFKKLK